MDFIPVHRPRLPLGHTISPYLKRIDEMRWYSNFGPLVKEFEERLAEHFNISADKLTTAVNGTLILTCLLKALNVPQGDLCVMPSWTFVATAASAHYAGLAPYFVDVDRTTQALQPEQLKEKLETIKKPIGAVIVIAPFGAPISTKSWDRFTEETNIPVIIDAAAGFDTVGRMSELCISKTPIMVSLHATKVFGIGEGGLALCSDVELISKVRGMTGFGFNMHREALLLGFNAKLPEYTAAVGLAALDHWTEVQKQWAGVRDHYLNQFKKINIASNLSPDWVTSTCNVLLPRKADIAALKLKESGIDTRKWWLNGCHNHKAYQHFYREKNLVNTDWLGSSVLGLPFAIDLAEAKIEYICKVLETLRAQ